MRASFQMREFEDRFVTLGMPYRVIGGPRFYERMEIRDALAYFRATVQPADDLAFERIVNTPKRGLGEATLKLCHDIARARRIPLMAAAAELVLTEELKPKARSTLRDLLAAFARWRAELDRVGHTELAEIILDESGYTEMWKLDRSADAPGRLENLKELVRSMQDFESMGSFLEHISLVMDAESDAGQDAVTLMTLHGAKGLEFDTVFLPGWEEGLFPHQRALDEAGRSGLEEERRLAYVGLTGRGAAPSSGSPRTGASTACGRPRSRRASSTNCPRLMSRCARRPATAADMDERLRRLRREPVRPRRQLLFVLHDPGLGAGAGARPGGRRQAECGGIGGAARRLRDGGATIEGELVARASSRRRRPSRRATVSST